MKTHIILIMLLCLTATAEVKEYKNRFGVIQNVVFTGYVMDAAHAKAIVNKRIGSKTWVGTGNLLRCGNLFMHIGKHQIILTASHQAAMASNTYSTVKRTITKTKMRTSTSLRRPSSARSITRRRSRSA